MRVETFECVETASEPIEATEEAIALIEEMGLTGQQSLLSQGATDKPVSRCPYREIRQDERFVYKTLCPKATEIKRYDAAPIPLRVLQIAAHAKSLGLFKRIIVWSQEEFEEKDPVLVACTDEYDFSGNKTYILARWGEELETFATLVKRACDVARKSLQQEARKLVSILEAATDAELMAKGPNREIHW